MTVLTNANGLTLYSFAPDTPARSNCNGSCAAYWPPVTGTPAAGPGITGRLGTITRYPASLPAGTRQPGRSGGKRGQQIGQPDTVHGHQRAPPVR